MALDALMAWSYYVNGVPTIWESPVIEEVWEEICWWWEKN